MNGEVKKMTSKKKSIEAEHEEEAISYSIENIPPSNTFSTQPDHQFTTAFDREFHARLGKYWALSPASVGGAYIDWITHLAISPGKQLSLFESAMRKSSNLFDYALSNFITEKSFESYR